MLPLTRSARRTVSDSEADAIGVVDVVQLPFQTLHAVYNCFSLAMWVAVYVGFAFDQTTISLF